MASTRGVEVGNSPASRRALVVVGMHRSGTSAMTRALSFLGAALPKKMLLPDADNPPGFWEPQSVTELNDEILDALDSEWDDVFAFRPREYLANFDRFYASRARELLNEEFDGAEVIVLKDPRISVLARFWDRALGEAGYRTSYIVMVRNPMDVAESLRTRNGFAREKTLLLWSSYMIALERDTRERERVFVAFDDLLDDWRSAKRRIEEGTNIPFPRDTVAASNEIDRFLDRKLRHHRSDPDSLFSSPDVPAEVKVLYRIFREACEGRDVDRAAVDQVRDRLGAVESLIGPVVADFRARTLSLAKELTQVGEAHMAARNEAETLARRLEGEDERRAEADAAFQATGELQRTIRELTAQLDALEVERIRAVALAEADRERGELKLAGFARESEGLQEQLATARSELAKLQVSSIEDAQRAAHERADLQQQLISAEMQSKQVVDGLANDLRRAEARRVSAESAIIAAETKLVERFQEIATLTHLLRQQEQQTESVHEQLQWLLTLQQLFASRPTWWNFIPASRRRHRDRRRLKRAGLFDSDAYLQRYPDVSAAGMEPLDHYLRHGIYEGRVRTV